MPRPLKRKFHKSSDYGQDFVTDSYSQKLIPCQKDSENQTMKEERIYNLLIHWLVVQRNMSGMTQTELSIHLGKTQSFVSKYENFDRKLLISEFISICKVLNCDPTSEIRRILEDDDTANP